MKRSLTITAFTWFFLLPVAESQAGRTPVTQGQLEIQDADLASPDAGVPSVVPLRHTDVSMRVRGPVVEVVVRQEFENILDRPIEAEYVFPLPDDAAVHATEMRFGDHVIEGRIARREEARRAYEQARADGRRASLLEQERPNIFTQSVANIGPGETVDVVIRYVQSLAYVDGAYEIVFPMVVGPRYIPGSPLVGDPEWVPWGSGVWPVTDEVADASRITPLVLAADARSGYDMSVEVDIDMGVPIADLQSRAHHVDVQRLGKTRSRVSLSPDDSIPNKDFVLNVFVAGEAPDVGVLAHHDGEYGYLALILQPPASPEVEEIRPREVICVLDCSGSMQGPPLGLAQRAAVRVLEHLRPDDRFNVISFSNAARRFQALAVPASDEMVRDGVQHVRSLRADGGTEMLAGVRGALVEPPPEGYLRIVVFFTDGYIGNETAILTAIQRMLGSARLFAFGTGSSVNRYLLARMARVGRGAADYILLDDDPAEVMDRFVDRLSLPLWTDIQVTFDDVEVYDLVPWPVPDVYAGMPVCVYGRYDDPGEVVVHISGRVGIRSGAEQFRIILPPAESQPSPLPSIWAREWIRHLELDRFRGADSANLEQEITELALSYSLMSAHTSFVAIDASRSGTGQGPPDYVPVGVPMPDGVGEQSSHTRVAGTPPPGRFGGGPVGPFGVIIVAVMVVAQRRRRRGIR